MANLARTLRRANQRDFERRIGFPFPDERRGSGTRSKEEFFEECREANERKARHDQLRVKRDADL